MQWKKQEIKTRHYFYFHHFDFFQDWTKYWFVLNGDALKYFKDSRAEELNTLDGRIDLSNCYEVSDVEATKNYGFKVRVSAVTSKYNLHPRILSLPMVILLKRKICEKLDNHWNPVTFESAQRELANEYQCAKIWKQNYCGRRKGSNQVISR